MGFSQLHFFYLGLLLGYRPFAPGGAEAIDSSSSVTLSLDFPFYFLQGGFHQLYFGISDTSPAAWVLSFRTSVSRGFKLEMVGDVGWCFPQGVVSPAPFSPQNLPAHWFLFFSLPLLLIMVFLRLEDVKGMSQASLILSSALLVSLQFFNLQSSTIFTLELKMFSFICVLISLEL